MYQEMKKLSNGVEIPVLALGTWFIDDDKVAEAVKSAIKLGYRHIDTAQAYGNEQGVGEALKNKAIEDMAEKYGVTIPQLCIRFDIQLGMIVLPKTANPEHMKVNADVDFIISDEDMESLKHVKKIKDYGRHSIFPVFGGKM